MSLEEYLEWLRKTDKESALRSLGITLRQDLFETDKQVKVWIIKPNQ